MVRLPTMRTPGQPGSVLRREAVYPDDLEEATAAQGVRLIALDASGLARQAGTERAANVVLLGAASIVLPFDEAAWQVTFEEFGQLLLPEVLQDRGEKEIMQLLIGVEFDVDNPRVIEFLEDKVHKFSFETNDTTIRALKKEFREALTEGEGIPQIEKRVRKVFGIAKRSRSINIARTEVIGASNFGAVEAHKQSGVVVEEEWLATKDDRTRDAHAAIDGERTPIGETFSNGLRFPGDPRGTPEQICQCRCTVLPIVYE